jgi:polyisoprenoid-binding protein YceI
MLVRLSAFLGLVFSFCTLGVSQEIKLDPEKSKVEFVGKKQSGEEHKGGFKQFTSETKVDWESPEKSKLSLEIKTDSMWSDNDKLTSHLKNPDFFNVDKFPKIKFESTSIKVGETEGTIVGKMTMLEKTVEVSVPVKVEVTDEKVVVNATFKIDRTKWGMGFGRPNINDEVQITTVLHYKR